MSERRVAPASDFWRDADDTEALRRYRTLVNIVDDGIYQLDPEGRFVAVNDVIVEMTGYARKSLLGKHVSFVIDEDDCRRIEAEIGHRLTEADQRQDTFELTARTADGDVIPCELRLSLLFDDGEFRGTVGIVRDVTERKRAEAIIERRALERELHERERQLSTLLANMPGMAYRCRNERDWPMESVSDGCRALTGYDPGALEGDAVAYGTDVVHEADREELWDAVQRGLEEDGSFLVSYRITTADGEVKWVEERGRGVYDESGTIEALEGVIIDVTERKRLEAELDEVLGRVTDAFYALDDQWRFTHVNERAEELLGRSEEELRGAVIWEAFPETAADDQLRERFQQAMETQEPSSLEVYSELFGFWVEANLYPSETGLSVYFRDITDRIERERDLEESRRQYRTLVENFPNGAVALVDQDLTYRTAGGTPVDAEADTFDDLEGTNVGEAISGELAEVLVPRYRAALEGEASTFEHEHDGRYSRFHIFPVRGDDGEVFAAMGMSQDVTEQKQREQYLRDAKSQLEAATQAGAVGTWEWDVQADELTVGPSFARTFGIDPEAAGEGVSLERFMAAIHEADRPRVERQIEAAVETCGDYEAEYRVRNAEGELRWVVARGHVECDADGTPTTFPGALTDITERKQTELELERNKEQLETLFAVLPVGVVVADADGAIVSANDTAHEIWGGDVFDAGSIAEYERYPVFDADTGERVAPEEMTLARVVGGEEVTDPDVYEIDAADGTRRIIELRGMPIRDEADAVRRGVVTLSDVTDRRRTQRRLEESERRYRTLVENFPNGAVALFDEDLRYTAAGGQLLEAVGTTSDEIVGQTIWDRYPADLAETFEPNFRAALAGEERSFEVEYHDRLWAAHTLPVRDNAGQVFAGLVMVQDVTERREYERRLEASNERLEQFAYAASHDLQEPLRMVSSYLRLIEDRYAEALDETGREFIEFAVDGAERMREMIDGLLEYSRVDTREGAMEPVDLDTVLADVRDDLQVKIDETEADITASGLPRVQGDRGQLRQLFQNLLDNAIEYSGDEPPRIRVAAERTGPAGEEWTIAVRDEGIGLDPAHADRAFEVFQSLHGWDQGGVGIGLALCERIVERHGGAIWVESEPGDGATFFFTLPAAAGSAG